MATIVPIQASWEDAALLGMMFEAPATFTNVHELVDVVGQYLPRKDALRAASVNRKWRAAILTDYVDVTRAAELKKEVRQAEVAGNNEDWKWDDRRGDPQWYALSTIAGIVMAFLFLFPTLFGGFFLLSMMSLVFSSLLFGADGIFLVTKVGSPTNRSVFWRRICIGMAFFLWYCLFLAAALGTTYVLEHRKVYRAPAYPPDELCFNLSLSNSELDPAAPRNRKPILETTSGVSPPLRIVRTNEGFGGSKVLPPTLYKVVFRGESFYQDGWRRGWGFNRVPARDRELAESYRNGRRVTKKSKGSTSTSTVTLHEHLLRQYYFPDEDWWFSDQNSFPVAPVLNSTNQSISSSEATDQFYLTYPVQVLYKVLPSNTSVCALFLRSDHARQPSPNHCDSSQLDILTPAFRASRANTTWSYVVTNDWFWRQSSMQEQYWGMEKLPGIDYNVETCELVSEWQHGDGFYGWSAVDVEALSWGLYILVVLLLLGSPFVLVRVLAPASSGNNNVHVRQIREELDEKQTVRLSWIRLHS